MWWEESHDAQVGRQVISVKKVVLKAVSLSYTGFLCVFSFSVLMIFLKRFLNGEKNQSPIAFPNIWQPFDDPRGITHNYTLQAHITHFGETVDSGNAGFKIFILK